MIELTTEQQQALAKENETPPRAHNPGTHDTYVLIKEDVYTRVKSLLLSEDDNHLLSEMYPHVMEVFGKEGWDEPAMDAYNDLDPRKLK